MGALFPVFVVSILGTFLIPATLARLASAVKTAKGSKAAKDEDGAVIVSEVADTGSEWGKAAAATMKKRKMTTTKRVSGLFRGSNLWYTIGWFVMIALCAWITRTPLEEKRFDPYDILELRVGATPKEIKNAYRKMSLKFHPDKNPDPSAAVYFAESIAPAYKTLTDDVARGNYEKYGHPDGKQSTKLGVALPEALFGKGVMAPVMLISLVVGGILLPLVIAMYSIRRSEKYGGSNVLKQTQFNFRSKMKPVIGLQRLPETLAIAHEFIQMPILDGQHEEVSKLLKDLKNEYANVDQKLMKRLPQIIKAHMLILALTSRKVNTLSPQLAADARKIGVLIPLLIEELFKLASMPINRAGHMFANPHESAMKFLQCFTQAVPISSRKASDNDASLLQLAHFDADKVLALKKTEKTARSVEGLLQLPKEDRERALKEAGFTAGMVQDIERQLLMIPRATTFTAEFTCDGDSKILEGDFITGTFNVKITRAGGPLGGVLPPLPFCAADRKEGWRLFVCDTATNTLLKSVTLDKAMLRRCESGAVPEKITMQFPAPPAGGYMFNVMLMSDYWIGVDASVACSIKIAKRTDENLQSRGPKINASIAPPPKASCCDDESHGEVAAGASESESDGDDNDDEDSDDDDDGYPSDETGTSESDDSVPVNRKAQPLPQKPAAQAARPAEDVSKVVAAVEDKVVAAAEDKVDDDVSSSATSVSNLD